MTHQAPQTTFLKDYCPPTYLVDRIDLHFDLEEERTTVRARMAFRRNADSRSPEAPLVLFGRQLKLKSLQLDNRTLTETEYGVDDETLTVFSVPGQFSLEVVTEIYPQKNTSLEGLYKSSGIFCTQCEAQGFRKITYFPDRPDVMARYSTTIAAERSRYPVLLSNGNLVDRGTLEDGRHFARWEDPFPKPSYLFALVAGDLVKIEDTFITRSGRKVTLQIFVEERNRDKCDHAMLSLKNAMRWDEETFGLEYDLDIYMILAVDDFNMGAMENKGLNIFNSKYVLARPDTATDADYQAIEEVIGHEYFHNWTGNRVTCRDWFQLSLKEGLTVFRDQEFSADMTSRAVKRIQDVRVLRNSQFPEDAGPMAHSVRPDSYVEINNFYTTTVYNKGAELIRMYQALLGVENFRKGITLYLERHDGQAVTTDDFLQAMADAGEKDLTQFALWYSQSGTPVIEVDSNWDAETGTYALTLRQSCPPTPGQVEKKPFLIPVATALLGSQGEELPLQLEAEESPVGTERTLELCEQEQTFRFTGLAEKPIPSLLRGFSAPVRLNCPATDAERAFLMSHDSDPFNRWEAGQQLACGLLIDLIEKARKREPLELSPLFTEAFRNVLIDQEADPALVSLTLTLPSETYLAEQIETADPSAVHRAREFVKKSLAQTLRAELLQRYRELDKQRPYTIDPTAIGERSLKNLCLAYLMTLQSNDIETLCAQQFQTANNMTDTLSALGCFANSSAPQRDEALAAFYARWEKDPLVLDKWFTLQATSSRDQALTEVKALMSNPAFSITNPNKVRALIGAFCHGNPARFHDASGEGYAFLADQVLALDPLNPQVAARLVGALSRWRRFDSERQELMKSQLQRILHTERLSKDVFEVVSKSLGNTESK